MASLRDEPRSLDNPPSIVSASFLPKPAEGLDVAGIGQNYVQIHPSQREGQQLEYGLATIEVKAEDLDGGPLRYTLKATANAGEGGNFSIADQEGDLSFVYDTALRRHVWKTTVSWRPPRLAPAGRTYNLSLTVHDPDANTAEVSTQADLLPAVTSLPAARIVVVTLDGRMFLTNLDGANEVLLTRDGKEFGPFFSQDGSIIFSFHDEPGSGARQLRGRPANGALSYLQLATFPNSTAKILFDPTYTFAAVIKPEVEYNFAWGDVTESTSTTTNEDGSTSTDTSYSFDQGGTPMMVSGVSILNLMANDPPIKLTDTGKNFYWAANARHTFFFHEEIPLPMTTSHGYGPFSPKPGHQTNEGSRYLANYPPVIVESDVEAVSAEGRIYNPANRNWYLKVEGGSLSVHNQASGSSHLLYSDTGGIESEESGRRNPSWSADGRWVTLVASPGGNARVLSFQVLTNSLTLRSPIDASLNLPASGASRAQLSPAGEWVYFHRGNKLLRVSNPAGSGTPTDITAHLQTDISDYVISP